jgi:hypothetical protein
MASAATPAPQSEASKIVGLLYTLGVAAAAIFVKNPNHQQTASAIVTTLNELLPEIESII